MGVRRKTVELKALYEFRGEERVTNFLFLRPGLVDVLKEARQKIDDYFGPGTPADIEIFNDPESDHRDLVVVIRSNLPPKERIKCLDRFTEEWWLDKVGDVRDVIIDIV